MNIPFSRFYVWRIKYPGCLLALRLGPSKRFTQIGFEITRRGITISNNCGGQLGPESLQIMIHWKPLHFSKYISVYP